jgi:hypothetical protein
MDIEACHNPAFSDSTSPQSPMVIIFLRLAPRMPEKKEAPTSKIMLHIHTVPDIREEISRQQGLGDSRRVEFSGRRRTPIPWSLEETRVLEEGVKEYGKGRWRQIFNKYRSSFHKERRSTDLADKYRLMKRTGSYYSIQRTNFVEVDENGEVVCNVLGEPRMYYERFPHDAAIRAGRARLEGDVEDVVINIQGEKENKLERHTYKVFRGTYRPRATKIVTQTMDKV